MGWPGRSGRLARAITPETILVSVQAANQEIGTLQDVQAIADIAKAKGACSTPTPPTAFRASRWTCGRFRWTWSPSRPTPSTGPRGIGGLYVREGTPIRKWMDGGFQEFDLRAGVENIPGAVGFAKAVELVTPEETARLQRSARPAD